MTWTEFLATTFNESSFLVGDQFSIHIISNIKRNWLSFELYHLLNIFCNIFSEANFFSFNVPIILVLPSEDGRSVFWPQCWDGPNLKNANSFSNSTICLQSKHSLINSRKYMKNYQGTYVLGSYNFFFMNSNKYNIQNGQHHTK